MPGLLDLPRRFLLKASYRTTLIAAAARRLRPRRRVAQLDEIQRRLELLVAAVYGRPMQIASIPAPRLGLLRLLPKRFRGRHRVALPAVDGDVIQLPSEVDASAGHTNALDQYRLLAIEQAARVARDTIAFVPTTADPLERDLYLLREGSAIDAKIAKEAPGLFQALMEGRAAALASRPSMSLLSPREREVERIIRRALRGDPVSTDADLRREAAEGPGESLAWAQECAARIRSIKGHYRGLPAISLWGTVRSLHPPDAKETKEDSAHGSVRKAPQLKDDPSGSIYRPDLTPAISDEHGSKVDDRAFDPSAATVESEKEVGGAGDPQSSGFNGSGDAASSDEYSRMLPPGTCYAEWDANASAYRKDRVTVRPYPAAEEGEEWASTTLAQQGALVRRVRLQFERLRARRTRLLRQRDGDELDIAACVDAMIDRRIGHTPDDRVYIDARPARRGIAIALVVDVSGSTETRVSEAYQIIDLEKIALLLASEALDAIGDLYAVFTFSGKGADDVRVTTIKGFDERSGSTIRRRISALTPGGFTRLGAAVRHATAMLNGQSAGHRLLLILSDGRPNDMDYYQDRYAVEDSRQAIMEARASGVFPFCLTVDREGSEYLPRIFGTAGHTILRHPGQLPLALLGVVRQLLRSA